MKPKISNIKIILITPKNGLVGFTETIYKKKSKELREELTEVHVESAMHNGADEKFAMTVSYLLSVSSRAFELFKSSKVEQK